LRRVKFTRVAEKVISQAVSFVFLTPFANDFETIMFLWEFIQN